MWRNTDQDTVTIAFAATSLVQYPIQCAPKSTVITEVGTPLLFQTGYHSSQRPLWNLTDVEWFPARYRHAVPYRRRKCGVSAQRPLPLE